MVLASAFLVSALLGAVSAVDAHRVFYARRFGMAVGSVAQAYARYIFALALLTLLGFLVCIGYFLAVEGSILVGVFAALFFGSERLSDESLRYTLFERNRGGWGILALTRVLAQMAAIGLVALLQPETNGDALFILALAIGNLLAFSRKLPLKLAARCFRKLPSVGLHLKASLKLIFASGTLWLISLTAVFGAYLDRVIVLAANKQDIAIFTLVVASMSVVQNGVEYFYFSQRRRDFLEGTISLRDTLLSVSYWRIVLISLVIGGVLTLVSVALYEDAPEVPVAVLLLVAVVQVTLATSAIAREIIYWRNQLRALLHVEMAFLTMVGCIFGVLYFLNPNYVFLIAAGALALLVRLFLLSRVSNETLPIL